MWQTRQARKCVEIPICARAQITKTLAADKLCVRLKKARQAKKNTAILKETDMQHKEDRLQTGCKTWFDLQHPKLRLLLHHSPNEGLITDKSQCAKRKAMGVRAGFPDFIFCAPRCGYASLAIELKSDKGRQSDTQKEWQKVYETQGGLYRIVRSLDEFICLIEDYLNGRII